MEASTLPVKAEGSCIPVGVAPQPVFPRLCRLGLDLAHRRQERLFALVRGSLAVGLQHFSHLPDKIRVRTEIRVRISAGSRCSCSTHLSLAEVWPLGLSLRQRVPDCQDDLSHA